MSARVAERVRGEGSRARIVSREPYPELRELVASVGRRLAAEEQEAERA